MEVNGHLEQLNLYCDNNDLKTAVFNDITSCNNYICNSFHDFKFIHLNIRSINKNFLELCVLLQSFTHDFDIIILTETWLYHDFGYDINGYNKLVKVNKYNKCDGIVIYFKNSIDISVIEAEIGHCNSLHFKIKLDKSEIFFTAIYRSPKNNKNDFIDNLEQYLSNLEGHNHIIVGDINIDILEDSIDLIGSKYMNVLHEYGFVKYLNAITRPSIISGTCIDHIFLKTQNNWSFIPGVLSSAITDHYIVFSLLKISNNEYSSRPSVTLSSQNMQQINYPDLITDFLKETWESVYNCNDANACFQMFYNLIIKYIDKNTITKSNQKISNKSKK